MYGAPGSNYKYHFLWKGRLQPYVLGGFGFPWLKSDDEAFPEAGLGVGLNAGGGIVLYLSRRVALQGGLIQRWNWFDNVKLPGEDEFTDFEERIGGGGPTCFGGIVFGFQ